MVTTEMVRTKPKLLTADDVWAMECDPANEYRYFYLIDGELYEDPMPSPVHADLAGEIAFHLKIYAKPQNQGKVYPDVGVAPFIGSDNYLIPDVAYYRIERIPETLPRAYFSDMPDIAVEVRSPSNTYAELRRKAETYLLHNTTLVWLVFPERKGVEVWHQDEYGDMQSQFVDRHGALRGDPALPGFTLELSLLFPPEND